MRRPTIIDPGTLRKRMERFHQTRIDAATPQTQEDGMIIWDHPPHQPEVDIVDVDGIGRYMVRRVLPRSRTFAVYLDGNRTSYSGTREQCHASVERIIANAAMAKAEGKVKYGDMNWLDGPVTKLYAVLEADGSFALGPSHDRQFHMLLIFTNKEAANAHTRVDVLAYGKEGRYVAPLGMRPAHRDDLRLAAEWGYKQCEKGESIDGMFANLQKLLAAGSARRKSGRRQDG